MQPSCVWRRTSRTDPALAPRSPRVVSSKRGDARPDLGSPLRRRLRRLIAAGHDREPARALARAARVFLDRYENLNYDMWNNGEHEVLRRIGTLAPRHIIDVGASVGDWTRLALSAAPSARIDCFDVVPETAAALADAMAGDPRVVVHPIGLADRDADVTVMMPADPGHAS